jgi:oligopeptide/dipeptide ABC transporter ATP-binding protein
MTERQKDTVLRVSNLVTEFHLPEGIVRAVNHINFSIHSGETLGLVGESGCGKSVTALSILRLIPDPPGKIVEGEILFNDQDLLKLPRGKMQEIRGSQIAMVFQEPMTALNPLFTVGDQISEVYVEHLKDPYRKAWEKSVEMLRKVGISPPGQRAREYIHQVSGGMRQRSMIAMALACNPRLIIADEPTTAVDVTIQAQVLELMKDLQARSGTAILLITHNLGVVAEMCDRVIVMYLGQAVEEAAGDVLFDHPLHPYTRGLIGSVPFPGRKSLMGKERLEEIPGMVPSMFDLPKGCVFHPRCREARGLCKEEGPRWAEVEPGHSVACWGVA